MDSCSLKVFGELILGQAFVLLKSETLVEVKYITHAVHS